jgi:NTE family protein
VVPPEPALRAILPKIGLALGGGGARGFAHIGALRVLEQEKIPIDVVVGTSVGSLVGALYADQGRVLDAEYNAIQVEAADLFDYRALSVFSGGMIKGDKLEKFLRDRLKNQMIEKMAVPFAAVAVDIKTGQTVIFDHGPAATAVHASCAIPGVFVPVEIDGVTYVDGGVTDPIPSDIARSLGAEVVIAMAIPAPLPQRNLKNPISVIHHAVSIMSSEIGALRAREADVVIWSRVGGVDYDDFSQKKQILEAGEAAAREALPAIRAAIAAKTRYVPADTLRP